MNTLDKVYLGTKIKAIKMKKKASEGLKHFFSEEKGVSNVVATIILLLIVVLIIGVFWDRLEDWMADLMDKIFGNEHMNFEGGDLNDVTNPVGGN